ncbi:hypothetical protein [Micromonospora sp. NPDC000442]|uniref:hypothetical protein n=1 Tax=Micromonospora sp. NPDC000442 TaxID=3364217 RepID=UPI0036B85AC9
MTASVTDRTGSNAKPSTSSRAPRPPGTTKKTNPAAAANAKPPTAAAGDTGPKAPASTATCRPVTAHASTSQAGALALLSLVIAVGVTLLDAPAQAIWPIAGYLIVNIAYSAWLKHVPLIDVFLVASGFVLRLLAGVLAISASLSGWLVLSIFCICLLFGIGKRRHELVVLGSSSQQHRPSLAAYSVQLLDYLALLSAGIGLMSFMSYLTTATVVDTFGRLTLTLSAPFMLFATFRYLQLIVVHRTGGNPARLLVRDRLLVVNCAIWSAGLLVAYLAA